MSKNSKGIIFGATGFIGSRVACKMTKNGAKLILHGKSKKKLEQLDDELKEKFNLRQILLQGDFTDKSFFNNLFKIINSRFNYLDFFMNFVGRFDRLSPLTNLTYDEWENMVQININSFWRILKELEPLLNESLKPRVVSIINTDSLTGKPYQNFFSISQVMKKVIGEIFYEENKRLKIATKIISIPLLDNGIASKISSQKNQKNYEEIIEKIIVEAFDVENNKLFVNLD